MKKIYNYLFPVFLSLFALAACDEDNEEIVHMSYTDPVAIVTNIEPAEGYAGSKFTTTGDDFGIRTEDIRVFIGSQSAEVVSCADKSIVAEVPESATDGKISIEVFGQRVETNFVYRVFGKPGVSVVKPSFGFPGASITFEGHDFISDKTLYTLTFGASTDKVEIVGTPTDTKFTAKVSERAVSGVMSLIMAEQVIDLSSYPFTVLKHATLDEPKDGDPVPSGFGGSAFAITGTNLVQELLDEPAEALEPLKVTFTKADGGNPIEATVDVENLTAKNIPLTVPAALEAGDYIITVTTPFETIGTQLKYTALPLPEVKSITPLKGYVDSKITISGKNFVSSVDGIEVKFGDTPATDVKLEGENNDIVVTVPVMTEFGEKTLSLSVKGVDIELGEFSTFEILASPIISSVVTNNEFTQTAVQVGDIITITGTGFQNSHITSTTFKGQELKNVAVVSPTQITATVSENCEAGEDVITLHFDGVDMDVVSTDKLNMLKVGSEVTSYVLKNYSSPFTTFAGTGEWTDPQDWVVNAAAKCNLEFGGLQNGTSLAMQMGWGSHNNRAVVDGQIYQTTSLPAGNYKMTVSFNEVGLTGNCSAYLVVCKGNQFVLINNVNDSNADIIDYVKVESAGDMERVFEIPEGTGDVSIGLVASIRTNQRYIKFKSVKVVINE